MCIIRKLSGIITLKWLSKNKDLKTAFKIIWILSGFVSLLIICTILCTQPDFVFKNMPTCEYKLLGKECFLCGTTRAFYQIKELNIQKAYDLNKFSIVLFSAMIINVLIIVINFKNNFKTL